MMKFINGLRDSLHFGRGIKYSRKGNFRLALHHYQAALKYHALSGDSFALALYTECIALTYARLGDYANARQKAEESIHLYRLHRLGKHSEEGIARVEELLKTLEQRDTTR